jgi:hypothetical protein
MPASQRPPVVVLPPDVRDALAAAGAAIELEHEMAQDVAARGEVLVLLTADLTDDATGAAASAAAGEQPTSAASRNDGTVAVADTDVGGGGDSSDSEL